MSSTRPPCRARSHRPAAEITEKQAELEAYDALVQGYRDLTAEELTMRRRASS